MGSQRRTGVPHTRTAVTYIVCVTDLAVQSGTRAILLTLNNLARGCDRKRIASLRAEKPKKKSVEKSLKIPRLVRNY